MFYCLEFYRRIIFLIFNYTSKHSSESAVRFHKKYIRKTPISLVIYQSWKVIVSPLFSNGAIWYFITFLFHYVYDSGFVMPVSPSDFRVHISQTKMKGYNDLPNLLTLTSTSLQMHLTKTMLELLKIKQYYVETHEGNLK